MEMLERYLIDIGAPTLAGLKMGSLFFLPDKGGSESVTTISVLDKRLSRKGIRVMSLKNSTQGRLVYVWRPGDVAIMLHEENNAAFLRRYGYTGNLNAGDCVAELRRRLAGGAVFPHEIGLFLGYPLYDVTGFIENAGKNFRLSGYWKVYQDRPGAEVLFQTYRACTREYKALYAGGKNIDQLTLPSQSMV